LYGGLEDGPELHTVRRVRSTPLLIMYPYPVYLIQFLQLLRLAVLQVWVRLRVNYSDTPLDMVGRGERGAAVNEQWLVVWLWYTVTYHSTGWASLLVAAHTHTHTHTSTKWNG
jgi:hypothetical protein